MKYSDLYPFRYRSYLEYTCSALLFGIVEYLQLSRIFLISIPIYFYCSNYYYLNSMDSLNPDKAPVPEDFEYPRGWYKVAESRDVPKGTIKSLQFCGKEIVIFRTDDGKASVADAICPHLGAHLGDGKIVKDCIECPFHGYQFNGVDGKCTYVPYSKHRINQGIRVWKVHEVNHGIYIWNDSIEGHEPDYELIPLEDIEYCHGKTEHFVSCLLQEIPENGSDIHHFNVLHKDFVHSWIQPITHGFDGKWIMSREPGRRHLAYLQVITWLKLWKWDLGLTRIQTEIEQVGPGIVHLTYHIAPIQSKITIIQTVTPIGPYLNRLHHVAYSNSRLLHLLAKLILQATGYQVDRDVGIWNRKQFLRQPKLVREDRAIMQYRRWFNQFYTRPLSITN